MLVAIVAVVILAIFFLWPEPARADGAVSARKGGFSGHHVGAGLNRGGGLVRGGGLRGRVEFGGGDFSRHRAFRGDRGRGGHRLLLGDRYRLYQQRRLSGVKVAPDALLGDRFRLDQRRRLDDAFLSSRQGRDRDAGKHDRGKWGGKRHGDRFGRRYGKWLGPAPLLLPYGGADVIVREVVVPVLIPVPAPRPAGDAGSAARLDPRGRVTLVGDEQGIVGDWAQGDVLPEGVPLVTLDPVAYDLPQPPLGEKYARVGNDVLRIDAGSRRITEIVAR